MTKKFDTKRFSSELRGCVKKSKIRPKDVKDIWHTNSKRNPKKREIRDPLEKDWSNKYDERWNKY
ncbi:MAG: hypothetical protein WC613_02345 [Candidatus Aenigmatarchaeota archaeon]